MSRPPELPVYPLWPLTLVSGRACTIVDDEGVEYLDMYGGHAVTPLGHCHPRLVEAISKQAATLTFYSNVSEMDVRRRFCGRLIEAGPDNMRSVFLSNSGSEANENALTLARIKTGRKSIVSFEGGFHGRSLLNLSICGIEKYRDLARAGEELLFHHSRVAPFNNPDAIRKTVDEDCAAVIVEPVQGLAGARAASKEFLQALRDRCDEVGALLIFDEVQCGSGRPGSYTVSQLMGIQPDLLTLAKGLAGGFPIGATLVNEDLTDMAKPGMLGSTFGGGPLACAAGLATLDVIESDKLLESTGRMGRYLKGKLSALAGVSRVDGAGLLIGIRTEMAAGDLILALREKHQIIAGSSIDPMVLRIMPPLILEAAEADRFVEAISTVLSRGKQ